MATSLVRVLVVAAAARGAQFVEALLFPLVAVSAGASTAAAGAALLAQSLFQGFAGLAHVLDEDTYRLMILVRAATIVLLPPLAGLA